MDSSQWTTDVQPASPQGPLAHDRERLAVFASHCDIVQAVRSSQAVLLCGSAGAGKIYGIGIGGSGNSAGNGGEAEVVNEALNPQSFRQPPSTNSRVDATGPVVDEALEHQSACESTGHE